MIKYFEELEAYINEHYVEQNIALFAMPTALPPEPIPKRKGKAFGLPQARQMASTSVSISPKEATRQLDQLMQHMGETFSQMLFWLIDERGLTDPEVYHKANIDRKHFSKIRTNPNYTPAKRTVLTLAIALKLSLDETKDLLRSVGYSLSNSFRFDVILCFFLEKEIYDIFEINEVLLYYNQPVLGG